jgi:hypothetical protein
MLKKGKFFLNFLFDKLTTEKQIHFILTHPSHLQLKCLIEICYNLLENESINLSPLLKKKIKSNREVIKKFINPNSKTLSSQRKLLQRNIPLFHSIISSSRRIISKAVNQ